MHLEEAKSVLQGPIDKRTFRFVRAAAVLCAPENANVVTIQELLDCLRLGNGSKRFALLAEYAATALYTRTKRHWAKGSLAETDVNGWILYLKEHGFI
jgi:hypothetical protein